MNSGESCEPIGAGSPERPVEPPMMRTSNFEIPVTPYTHTLRPCQLRSKVMAFIPPL